MAFYLTYIYSLIVHRNCLGRDSQCTPTKFVATIWVLLLVIGLRRNCWSGASDTKLRVCVTLALAVRLFSTRSRTRLDPLLEVRRRSHEDESFQTLLLGVTLRRFAENRNQNSNCWSKR